MNGLPISWKIFRIICILQLLMVATKIMLAISRLFAGQRFFVHGLEIIVYILMFVFLYQGLSLLNYNYPDIPLTDKQKRQFNLLFLVNFLVIAFLFAMVVSEYRLMMPLFVFVTDSFKASLAVSSYFLFTTLVFLFHLVFLFGMYTLRRGIYQRTIDTWYHQFDENKPGEK
jgi:hypothetical protein